MPLHRLSEEEQRSYARKAIESLEHWLRRLVHEKLSARFGHDYINGKLDSGDFVISKPIRKFIASRLQQEPHRYPRPIDATTLEYLIKIVCHPNFYKELFREALCDAYPDAPEEASTFLNRINEARNNLSHANLTTVRQVERIICYSNDVIDSLKGYYIRMNQEKDYNAPMIIRVADSYGNEAIGEQIRRNNTGRGGCHWYHTDVFDGDTLSVEIEVDPSFDESEYTIEWVGVLGSINVTGKRLRVELTPNYIRHDYCFYAKVISNKSWHRCGDCDDCVSICYKIRPRL
jgi:hypothetical protein